MPILADLARARPALLVGIRMADLRQHEVDAALRAGGEPPERLVGHRLCRIGVAIYLGAQRTGSRTVALDREPWVVPDGDLRQLASARWLTERGHAGRAVLKADSPMTLALAVTNGVWLGIITCYLADGDPRLARVGEPLDDLAGDLWFLTHPELRHSARIRAVSDHLAREVHALHALFHGTTPQHRR